MKLTKAMGDNRADRGERWRALLFGGLLVAVVVAFSSIYFNNTYPISEGWGVFDAELVFRGKIPYRDFYYYMPPFSLYLDALLWRLSFGLLIVYRGWRLAERVLIYVLMFNLLRRYFNSFHAFVGCALTSIISTGDVYDLVGDYNQTTTLLAILLLYGALSFLNTDTRKGKLRRLFLCGGVLGLIFLSKQTIFVASFLCYFLTITILCVKRRDGDYLRYCLAVALGMLVPIGIAALYLQLNGALMPFIDQVYLNVDGKGSLTTILVRSLTRRALLYGVWALALVPLALVGYANRVAPLGRSDRMGFGGSLRRDPAVPVTLALSGGMVLFYCETYKDNLNHLWRLVRVFPRMSIIFAFAAFVFVASALLLRRFCKFAGGRYNNTLAATLCAAVLLVGTAFSTGFSHCVRVETRLFDYVQYDANNWSLFSMVLVFVYALLFCGRDTADDLLFFACAGFSVCYSGIMASGGDAGPAHILRVAMPFMICFVLAQPVRVKLVSKVVKGLLWVSCVGLCIAVISQKVDCSYSWWGTTEEPVWEKTFASEVPALKGLRFSRERRDMYDRITDIIEKNTDEDSVIWGYPHIKLFNILVNNYNMDTFVPVLFPDVVSDKYVLVEYEQLKLHHPDIVVWERIPNMLEQNAAVFRGGQPYEQKKIEALFDQHLLPYKYNLVGSFHNVSVYKRKIHTRYVQTSGAGTGGEA